MRTISVAVKEDHLHRMAQVKRPILAIAELIWNGLDADATEVKVTFESNPLGGLDRIRVTDNGTGMRPDVALDAFGSLGGSWKRTAGKTQAGKRLLHGRAGKGRFRAFSIGELIEWNTRFRTNGNLMGYLLKGSSDHLGTFEVEDPAPVDGTQTGTDVVVSNIQKAFQSIRGPEAIQAITEQFAIYLREYSDVSIIYDGTPIRPAEVEKDRTQYELPPLQGDDGEEIKAELWIIEWKIMAERALFLCDEHGFTLERVSPGIHAVGFEFTAYLRSDYLRKLDDQGLLSLDEMHPTLVKLLGTARDQMRDHFRGRAADAASELVAEWKKDKVYPFEGEPKSNVERAERQVFEVVALNVHNYMPGFRETTTKQQQLSLRLLRQAIENSPDALRRILSDVLDLPEDKRNDLAQLLKRTSLSAIITASKLVASRLDFLQGLEYLVFNPESKDVLLERKQLHKIVEHETWVFGEEFNLTASDQSLTEVLRKHLHILRGAEEKETKRAAAEKVKPVRRQDDSTGIVDLMLSRRVPHNRAENREHLVVELKRPTRKIDLDALNQVETYAFAVADDDRFQDTNTKWIFWAVSNQMDDAARRRTSQGGRPEGVAFLDTEGRVEIWAKTWGQLIQDCRARLDLFQRSLEYTADEQSALEYLRALYQKYLPAPAIGKVS